MKNPKEVIGDKIGIPKDISLDLPRITASGNREIYIENYKSLIAYDSSEIIIGNKKFRVSVTGEKMEIKSIRRDDIVIFGQILHVDFKM